MVLLMFLIDIVIQLSSYVVSYSVSILYISTCISWQHSLFLATNSFSWLTQVYAVILDVPHLQDHDFLVEFALVFSDYLECRFFLLYKQFYYLSILVLYSFPVLSELPISWYCSSIFLLVIWFFLPPMLRWQKVDLVFITFFLIFIFLLIYFSSFLFLELWG